MKRRSTGQKPGHCAMLAAILAAILATGMAHAQEAPAEETASQCKDGIDNDGDGLMDCSDPGCRLFVFCIQPASGEGPQSTEAAAVPPSKEKDKGKAGTSTADKGGMGIYAVFVPWITWNNNEDLLKPYPVTGGFAFWGEKRLWNHFAVGAELFHVFPARKGKDCGYDASYCPSFSMVLGAMVRFKFPFQVSRTVGLYPLITTGILVQNLLTWGTMTVAFGYSAGFGIEFYPNARITPCIEARYFGGAGQYGWRIYHSMLFNIGFRAW
jgi:hypothetical protein